MRSSESAVIHCSLYLSLISLSILVILSISVILSRISSKNRYKNMKDSFIMRGQDPQTRVLHELWSMMVHTLRPPLFPGRSLSSSSTLQRPQISPAAFGLLFIGISMALMLFGIVTFLIGFVLMPLVIMLVLLFYFVGIVSKLSEIGRSILWPASDCIKSAPVWNYSN